MSMTTTIQISESLQDQLIQRKLFKGESYEDVIWDLVEDSLELSEETKRHIQEYETNSEKWFKEGKFKTLGQIKKEKAL